MLNRINVVSIQSPTEDDTCEKIAQYLGIQLGIPTEFVKDATWQERERLLDTQQAQVGWICGLPYVQKVENVPSPIELLVAPVMKNPRYHQKPIYFSDVIVHQESEYQSFSDLQEAIWAINEPNSQSGCNVTRYHLAKLGEDGGYFGKIVEAGSHVRAIEMVMEREIDASAIDSTVLERELETKPHLRANLRVIEVLGPSPAPPWVVTKNVRLEMREAIRKVFLEMHKTRNGKAILELGYIARMELVSAQDYDVIREMAFLAEKVVWK